MTYVVQVKEDAPPGLNLRKAAGHQAFVEPGEIIELPDEEFESLSDDFIEANLTVIMAAPVMIPVPPFRKAPDGAVLTVREMVLQVQEISASKPPTGGTYTLSWLGSTTKPIRYDASVDVIVAAIAALPLVGAGQVENGGGRPLHQGSPLIRMVGTFAGIEHELMTIDGSRLTPAKTPVTVTEIARALPKRIVWA